MPAYFPRLLFGSVGAACLLLAFLEWKPRRSLAMASIAVGGFSLLCFATDYAWARIAIRIDLLVTIPAVALGALALGVMAARGSFLPARTLGALLAAGGSAAFAWYAYATVSTAVEGARITARYDNGNRLFWNETIRCEGNFEKRFGSMERRDDPCVGNLAVLSRSSNAYPFTRVVLNDRGEAELLFSPQNGSERPVGLRTGPFALMTRESSGEWSGAGDSGFGATRIVLTPRPPQRCEATITRYGKTSTLSLERIELPPCHAENPQVTYLGPWGAVSAEPGDSRRLLQIWMWSENSTQGRGVLASALWPSGARRDFIFVKPFRAQLIEAHRWTLHVEPSGDDPPGALTMTFDGSRARVTGPANLVGNGGEAALEKTEIVSDPRIELVPLRDRSLFEHYLDDALFSLDLSWTAP